MAKESNGKAHATSRAGASGPMQFMYATGKRFGLGPDGTGFDTRYDPHASAVAAAAYLNERLGQLNNSIEMSLAARSEEHTSELQSLMRISYAVFCLKKKTPYIEKQNIKNNYRVHNNMYVTIKSTINIRRRT